MRPMSTYPTLALVGVLTLSACSESDEARSPKSEKAVQRGPHAPQGTIVSDVPGEIRPDQTYIFYLHGRIIEDQGLRPIHPRFGVYEYEAILDSLAAYGLVVISEARPRGTQFAPYAAKVASQIGKLLAAGVPPERISVIGFSKGGMIAALVSSMLQNERINFIFLACCGDWMMQPDGPRPVGRILSMYDASDELVTSCRGALEAAGEKVRYREIELQVGEGHGVFYRPISEWLRPVVRWVQLQD